MVAWADAIEAPPPPVRERTAQTRQRPRVVPRTKQRRRSGMFGGVLWIGILAGLLAGIVTLNVAVLQLNVELDRLGEERANLRAENAALDSRLASAAAAPEIEALAQSRLGLVPAEPEQTTYVQLRAARK